MLDRLARLPPISTMILVIQGLEYFSYRKGLLEINYLANLYVTAMHGPRPAARRKPSTANWGRVGALAT